MNTKEIINKALKTVKKQNAKVEYLIDCIGYSTQEVGEMSKSEINDIIKDYPDFKNWNK